MGNIEGLAPGLAVSLLLIGVFAAAAPSTAAAETEAPRVITLSGTPYELGWQHGTQLKAETQASVPAVLGYFRRFIPVPLLGHRLVNGWLDRAWRAGRPYIAPEYLEELRGLSEASGVPLKDLARLHAIPERTYTCANVAAWGQRTREGRLIHLRNLDWNIDAGLQEFAAVFIVRPEGKRPYLSAGWA